jgi:hypothetical protein
MAGHLVDEHWPAIVRVAGALVERAELSSARIEALIRLSETEPRIATQIATQRRSTIRDGL